MEKAETYKAIHIDSEKREVKIVDVPRAQSLKTLQELVGGYITYGFTKRNGDVLMVDDDGYAKGGDNFFILAGAPQPFIGNGVIVAGDEYTDVLSNLEDVKASVKFATLLEIKMMLARQKLQPQEK